MLTVDRMPPRKKPTRATESRENATRKSGRPVGRPPVEHEREEFTIRLRSELMDIVREEMAKSRPQPTRNDIIEVFVEDALIARGHREKMTWLPSIE